MNMSIVFEIDASSGDVTTAGNITATGNLYISGTTSITDSLTSLGNFTIGNNMFTIAKHF